MNKEELILEELKKAREEGIFVAHLYNDWETSNAIGQSKHRLKKICRIVDKGTKWILLKDYWEMSYAEFRYETLHWELERIAKDRYILVFVILISLVLGYTAGSPNNLDECASRFGFYAEYGETQ